MLFLSNLGMLVLAVAMFGVALCMPVAVVVWLGALFSFWDIDNVMPWGLKIVGGLVSILFVVALCMLVYKGFTGQLEPVQW